MQRNNVGWEPCTGVYSSSYQAIADEDICLVFQNNQAINYMNYKDKYLVVINGDTPELLHIDSQGNSEILVDKNSEKYEAFKGKVLTELLIRPLNYIDDKSDFYIIPSSFTLNTGESVEARILKEIHNREESETVDAVKRITEEGRTVFVIYSNDCYLVDRKLNTVTKLNCMPEEIQNINRIVGAG